MEKLEKHPSTRDMPNCWETETRLLVPLVAVLSVWAILAWTNPAVAQTAVAHSSGSLTFEVLSPSILPSAFELNPGGTIPGNFDFPDGSNTGQGSFVAGGAAGCSPIGCTDPVADTDLMYDLSTDLTCSAGPVGTYGGLEDSFALLGASNSTGSTVELELRFTSSWSLDVFRDGTADQDQAEADVFISWAIPDGFCTALSNCPSGLIVGGSAAECPAGFVSGATLALGMAELDSTAGSHTDESLPYACDVTVRILYGASSGGDLAVTSSCAASADSLLFEDGFESGTLSAW